MEQDPYRKVIKNKSRLVAAISAGLIAVSANAEAGLAAGVVSPQSANRAVRAETQNPQYKTTIARLEDLTAHLRQMAASNNPSLYHHTFMLGGQKATKFSVSATHVNEYGAPVFDIFSIVAIDGQPMPISAKLLQDASMVDIKDLSADPPFIKRTFISYDQDHGQLNLKGWLASGEPYQNQAPPDFNYQIDEAGPIGGKTAAELKAMMNKATKLADAADGGRLIA